MRRWSLQRCGDALHHDDGGDVVLDRTDGDRDPGGNH